MILSRCLMRCVNRGISAGLDRVAPAPAKKNAKNMTPEELRHHAEMEKLYRKEVLKEQPGVPVLQIQGLKKAPPKAEPEPTGTTS